MAAEVMATACNGFGDDISDYDRMTTGLMKLKQDCGYRDSVTLKIAFDACALPLSSRRLEGAL